MMTDPHFREDAAGDLWLGDFKIAPDTVRHARFYLEYPPLALPHQHAKHDIGLEEIEVACDACGKPVAPALVHGTVNDHPGCVEIRFAAICPRCSAGPARVIHNVLRIDGSRELALMRAGGWVRTVSWWRWFRCRWGF